VGAKIARLMGYALRRSVHKDLIDLHLGQWSAPQEQSPTPGVSVIRWLTAQESGIIESLEPASTDDPSIKSVEFFKKPGDAVSYPFENVHRIGYVMTAGPSREQAQEVAEQFIRDTKMSLRG
jgi:hypothetical protein